MPQFDGAALQHCLHSLLVDAIQAMEGAGRTVCDFPDALPWEFTMDMARQVWDKARHVDIFMQLPAHVEGDLGEPLETAMAWRCAWAQTPEERVAGVDRGLTGLSCDRFAQLMELARQIGDPMIERALDCVLADDLTHVRIGSKWLRGLPADAPERLRKTFEFQQSLAE